jgi:hypothetical protein
LREVTIQFVKLGPSSARHRPMQSMDALPQVIEYLTVGPRLRDQAFMVCVRHQYALDSM